MIHLILISGLWNIGLLLFLNLFRKPSMIPYLKDGLMRIAKER